MKRNHLQRHIRIAAKENNINTLESFIEQICDDFHIYDAYFGNIMASNTLVLEMCMEAGGNADFNLDIFFSSKPSGMFFKIKLCDYFLDIVKHYDKIKDKDISDQGALSGESHRMMMIKLLCDEIRIKDKEESIELIFYITGINEQLTNQRIELLEKYYSIITATVKQ